jgi:M-phase-specific PLK1-interacting protein
VLVENFARFVFGPSNSSRSLDWNELHVVTTMEEEPAPESSNARKARLKALRETAAVGQPVETSLPLPAPFQQPADAIEHAATAPRSFYSDPLTAYQSAAPVTLLAGGTPTGFSQQLQEAPSIDAHINMADLPDGLPLAFASSRRGWQGTTQQQQLQPQREPQPKVARHHDFGAVPKGRGPGRGGGRFGAGERGGGAFRGHGLDAYISRSMVEDPWAPLMARNEQRT